MSRNYEEVKADCLELCAIDSNADLSGIDAEMWVLMANPTKRKAKNLYETAIGFWFSSIGVLESCGAGVNESVLLNENVIRLGEKYGYL